MFDCCFDEMCGVVDYDFDVWVVECILVYVVEIVVCYFDYFVVEFGDYDLFDVCVFE